MTVGEPSREVPGFEVLEQVATGGLAEVYLARDLHRDGQLVALKFLREEDIDRADRVQAFLDEVELSTLLVHPTIVRVFHGEFVYGAPYLVMEYVDGITVWELLERARELHRDIPLGVAAYVAAMVADALAYAHALRGPDDRPLGLVHRDVSTVNVMITFDGAVKLLDFGIARSRMSAARTAPGIIKGKLPYMSPEQCSGRPVDALTDIYSLGVVLFEMICGQRPFPEEDPGKVFAKVLRGDRPRMHALRPDVSPRLERIVDRAMATKPSARYPVVTAMLADLRSYMERLAERPTSTTLATLLAELAPEESGRVLGFYGPPEATEVASIEVVAGALAHEQDRTPTAPRRSSSSAAASEEADRGAVPVAPEGPRRGGRRALLWAVPLVVIPAVVVGGAATVALRSLLAGAEEGPPLEAPASVGAGLPAGSDASQAGAASGSDDLADAGPEGAPLELDWEILSSEEPADGGAADAEVDARRAGGDPPRGPDAGPPELPDGRGPHILL